MPVRAGRLVPRPSQGRRRRARSWSIRATPTPSPARCGREATKLTAKLAAEAAGCDPGEVFLASTGVIGEPLDATKFGGVMDELAADAAPGKWHEAAAAIMTTDTFPKGAAAIARLGATPVTICGIAKGAGMIAPDMATMLAFVFTDAPISAAILQRPAQGRRRRHLQRGDHRRRHLDVGHAAGLRHRRRRRARRAADHAGVATRGSRPFRKAFDAVLANLAEQVARDGEGARKLVEVIVEGAASKRSARKIALSIANSPLVKTAIAGEDANWGRVVMAVGKAGEPADRDKLSIWFGGIRVAHKGERDPGYDEAEVSAAMKKPEITLKVALGLGRGRDRVLTCDLTKEYVAINGDYRS